MELKDILTIGGKPGLYKLIARSRGGVVVEHLTEGKRLSVSARAQVSALEEIAIFTMDDERPLKEVFQVIFEKENGGETISHKSSARELEAYFKEVVPNYDDGRVYTSDIKKVIAWYNTLLKTGHITAEEQKAKPEAVSEKKVSRAEKKPAARKPAAKKPVDGKKEAGDKKK